MRICLVCLLMFQVSAAAADKPVKVYILAGQSNMEGKAQITLLEKQIQVSPTKELFAHFHNDGRWLEREDVHIRFLDRHGPLSVGYGSPGRIGPELQFGHVVGDFHEEPVLLIKTAWGGKSLFRDFRSPSSGLPPAAVLQQDLARAQKKRPETTMDDIRMSYGHFYREMLVQIRTTFNDIDTYVPNSDHHTYELQGFVWFQGWNDMINPEYTTAYTQNMVNFIRDVRRDLGAPDLPFVIGQLGVGGLSLADSKPNPKRDAFKAAQAAAGDLPEFQGNVTVVRTDAYWDMDADAVFQKGWKDHREEWEQVGSDYPYHYLGSARTYTAIGGAFADAVLQMQPPATE